VVEEEAGRLCVGEGRGCCVHASYLCKMDVKGTLCSCQASRVDMRYESTAA
jgi:hypothetical protein